MILEQAIDECREIKEAIDDAEPPERVQAEIGDFCSIRRFRCVFFQGWMLRQRLARQMKNLRNV
ncbi:putative mazG-like protein [Rickettsia parkeri str. Tate's Hell]|uniref:MazG-like protein n=1 Tax=Rickettsia parkeri str. Tate's Hell TaxID=1359189 RepID=A0ABR5DN77_RICPA|nr:putative mazG-like protein [Rickettsia parkeri str. Grand Bay]KJV96452.1 putative mazG-like protein [Rickettsia parkeri str. AT\